MHLLYQQQIQQIVQLYLYEQITSLTKRATYSPTLPIDDSITSALVTPYGVENIDYGWITV